MNEQDRELLKQVLSTAGEVGAYGWEQLVRWHFVDGLMSAFGWAVVLGFLAFLLRKAFAWKPVDEDAHVVRGVALVTLSILSIITFAEAVNGARDAIMPEGAAIRAAIDRD